MHILPRVAFENPCYFQLENIGGRFFLQSRGKKVPKKKPRRLSPTELLDFEKIELDLNDVLGLEALVPAGDLEFNAVPLVQRFVSLALNGRMVHEYILTTVLGDKTKTLLVLKPLHSSLSHCIKTSSFF